MTQLQTLTLEAGETVWRYGIPMRLVNPTEVETHPGNVALVQEARGPAIEHASDSNPKEDSNE